MLRPLLPVFLLAAALSAQQEPPPPSAAKPQSKPAPKLDKATQKELARWLERARYWTDAALEEEWRLDAGERPILYARLGELWGKADASRSRGYIEQAFSAIEHPQKNETVDDAKMRLQAANALTEFGAGTDARLRARAIRVVEQILDEYPNEWQLREYGMTSLEGGLVDAVRTDMPTALSIARTMIQHDSGNHFQGAWINIASQDQAQGDRLYQEALQRAAQSHDDELLFGLGQIAFPQQQERPEGWPVLPDQLKQAYLNLLYREFTRPAETEAEGKTVCGLFLGGARLIHEFPPAQMGTLQPIAERCQAQNKYVKTEIQAAQKQLKTSDDYLHAAETEGDLETRINLKFTAARLARSRKEYARALDILDAFTGEEKDKTRQWPSEWRSCAMFWMMDILKTNDRAAMRQLLERAPDDQKPPLYVQAVNSFEQKDPGLARSMYMEYRQLLEHTDVDQPQAYTGLIGLCLMLAPSEMPQVLKVAVDGINHIPPGDPKKSPVAVLGYQFGPIGVPGREGLGLGDQDDQMMRAAIAELTSPHNRTAFRVSMVRSILARYDEERAKATTPKKSAEQPVK